MFRGRPATHSYDSHSQSMPNLIGIIVLAVLTAALALLVPDEQVRHPIWVFVFFALAASAVFCWRHKEAPRTPSAWLYLALISILGAMLLFAADGIMGLVSNPSATFMEALTANGWFVVNFAVSPLGTFIALSGWARSVASSRPLNGG